MEEARQKRKWSWWQRLILIVGCIVVGFGLILGAAVGYFRLSVADYYRASQKAFRLPGLRDGYVAQGLCYDEQTECFLLSGYKKDGSPSPVYVVEKDGTLVKTVYLAKPNGKDYTGHGSGIAISKDYVYLAGGSAHCIYAFRYADLMAAQNGERLTCAGALSNKSEDDAVRSSFIEVSGDRLIIGEYYDEGEYETPDSHKLTAASGVRHCALALEYRLDEEAELGIDPTPIRAYSLPDYVQGLALHEGQIYLSTSHGATFSHIYAYDESRLVREADRTVIGQTLPLYVLDGASRTADYKIAPMSEEIAFVDGLLYVNCESASDKYIFGKFTGGQWMYKTDLSKMKKK